MKITIKATEVFQTSEYTPEVSSCVGHYTNDLKGIKEIKIHFLELVANLRGNHTSDTMS
jgi:hypothetical protein